MNIAPYTPYLIGFSIIGLVFGLGFVYVDYSNTEYKKQNWEQEATVIETYVSWGNVQTIMIGDDGERYSKRCNVCLVDDKVNLKMNKHRIISVEVLN